VSSMKSYQTEQNIKDRYSYIFKEKPEISCSQESLDSCAHIIAGIIENHQEIIEKTSVHDAQMYFIDVVGFYVLLCYDIQKTNERMLEIMEEHGVDYDI